MHGLIGCWRPGPTCFVLEPRSLDQTISSLDQKGGDPLPPIRQMMLPNARSRHRRNGAGFWSARRWGGAVGTVAALAAVVIAAGGAQAAVWESAPQSWSNGQVLCEFAASLPSVSASALNRAQSGLTAEMDTITEVSSGGEPVAVANGSSVTWSTANLSTDDAYDLEYSAQVPVTIDNSPAPTAGDVAVRVDFVLPLYDEVPSQSTDAVAVNVSLSDWPWQSPADHLVLRLTAFPAYPANEHLVLGSGAAPGISSVSSSNGATWEQLVGASWAIADPSTVNESNVSASVVAAGNTSWATLSITFGSTAGSFASLNYSAVVHVAIPSSVVGIPTIDFVVVGGVSAIVALAVAVGARRVRRRPSDLTYVGEEDPR